MQEVKLIVRTPCLVCCVSKEGLEAVSLSLSFYQKSCVHMYLNNVQDCGAEMQVLASLRWFFTVA